MLNDTNTYSFEKGVLMVNGEAFKGDIKIFVANYIKEYDIAGVGVKIVWNNALRGYPAPSGAGTMLNLFNIMLAYKNQVK